MKSFGSIVLSLLTCFLFLTNCSSEKKQEMQSETIIQTEKTIDITSDMLTTHIDLVCGMDLREHAIKDTTIYKGQLYGFCSSYCKIKFLEDPETMISKLEK